MAPLKWLLESRSGGDEAQKRPLLQDPSEFQTSPGGGGEAIASVSQKRVDQALAGGFTFVPYSCPQLSTPMTGLKFGFLPPVGV